MRFSQRLGINPVEKAIQRESIDEELRNSLWNALYLFYWETFDKYKYGFYGREDFIEESNRENLIYRLWAYYFKSPIDDIPKYFWNFVAIIRSYFFDAAWYEIYDFIEFIALSGPEEIKEKFIKACNKHLEMENSAYRFVNGYLCEITSEQEMKSIENAVSVSDPFPGVKEHLNTALDLMSDKTNPDYRNSIKEAISAVESLCKHLVGDENATLGSALKTLEQHKNLHPALKKAFSSLYGYTSDGDGIRHSLMDQDSLTNADARYMLVTCTAFINYAIDLVSD